MKIKAFSIVFSSFFWYLFHYAEEGWFWHSKEKHEALEKKIFYSKEKYLEMEAAADYKSEYYNGEIFAMSGGSYKHSIICVNLNWKLAESVADKNCIAFDSNLKLDIPKFNSYVYPDLMVVCGDIELAENTSDAIIQIPCWLSKFYLRVPNLLTEA